MNRLKTYLKYRREKPFELCVGHYIEFPEDVEKLTHEITEIGWLNEYYVEELYEDFSDEMYCASWLDLEGHVKDFEKWLDAEPGTGACHSTPVWYPSDES